MGRRKFSESEGLSDISSKSENFSASPQLESPPRKKLKKKYKKSHKYKVSDSEYSEAENEYIEKKKHKHHHKKHKSHRHRSEHYEENESYRRLKRRHGHHSSSHETRSKHHKYNAEVESRNHHSSHKKRERERHRIIDNYASREVEEEQESGRWDDNEEENDSNLLTSIKTEPGSSDERRSRSRSRSQRNHVEKNEQKEKTEWGKDVLVKKENVETKESVNFGLSGKLTEDANTYNGIVIKYSQPPEARKPKRRWRWYIFKGDEELPFLPLHRQSAYLIGRERKVADIPTDHPSCSKQHAVLQYRLVSYQREDGTVGRTVKPYILDLESANGTYVNNRRIEARRYVELLEKDVVKFGYSSREYVLLHEASKGSDEDMPDVGTDLSPVSLLRGN